MRPFNLAIQFFHTDQETLDARLNVGLAPANCIPYAGASEEGGGTCGYYHIARTAAGQGRSGLHRLRLLRRRPLQGVLGLSDPRGSSTIRGSIARPIPEEDPQTCPNESNCFTQDITDLVDPNGDSNTGDPGIGGKSKGFSDYEVVDWLGRPDPCVILEIECTTITHTFTPDDETNKFDFGNHHFIKITANVLQDFDLTVEFVPITQAQLNDRLNEGLAPANCIPYDGATSNAALGTCGYYHIVDPLPIKGVDYDGDVGYKVFWDFPTLDQLHNVRLYRAPIPQEDQPTCANGIDCFTQDITGAVYAVGDSLTGDPGIGGKSKGFSDYEVVDLTSATSPAARIWIGLKKSNDAGIRFDLKAVVKRNGNVVSSGELLGAPGGGKGSTTRTCSPSRCRCPRTPSQAGDQVSIKLLVRNSCLGKPPELRCRAAVVQRRRANSRVDEPGAPTLYLVRGDDDEVEMCDHGDNNGGDLSKTTGERARRRRTWTCMLADVPSCDGPYKSFGKWSGTVPY